MKILISALRAHFESVLVVKAVCPTPGAISMH